MQFIMDNENMAPTEMEEEKKNSLLLQNINHLFIEHRLQMISDQLAEAKAQLANASPAEMLDAMKRYKELKNIHNQIAALVGRSR